MLSALCLGDVCGSLHYMYMHACILFNYLNRNIYLVLLRLCHLFLMPACILWCSIQTVDTSENGLLSLPPPYAWKSRALREIKMTGNKVSKLDFSDCGRFWPKLESLYLGQNKLKEVR